MKIAIERHKFAPELNAALVIHRGRVVASMAAPGCQSIREARALLFSPAKQGRKAIASYTRPAPWQSLNREYAALYPLGGAGLRAMIQHARQIAARHDGGPLNDGRVLPAAARALRTSLQG